MPIFGVVINDAGEVVSHRLAPHQADDCDGLIYKATGNDGTDLYLFLIQAGDECSAVLFARDTFEAGEYVALDPIWQPGSIWPDRADDATPEQACVQIYSPNMGSGYITTVQTHKRTNPFIDHFGENIMWAYMRDIAERCCKELTEANELAKEQRRRQEEQQEALPVGEPTGTVAEPQQLFLDFG